MEHTPLDRHCGSCVYRIIPDPGRWSIDPPGICRMCSEHHSEDNPYPIYHPITSAPPEAS